MRILPYYIAHAFFNSIKKLFKSKVLAIMICVVLGFGLIGGVIGVGIGIATSNSTSESSSYEQEIDQTDQPQADEDEVETGKLSEKDKDTVKRCVSSGAFALSVLLIALFIYTADKSGMKIFTMPDVNFLFSAPLKPQSVLLFKTVLQSGIILVSSIYYLFQIPNLMNLGLTIGQCLFVIVAFILIMLYGQLTSIFTYTLTATHTNFRKYVRPFAIALVSVFVLWMAYLVKFKKVGFLKAFLTVFDGKYTKYVPIFGWIKGIVNSFLFGDYLSLAIFFALIPVSFVIFTALIWNIKADFYEDALQNAEKVAEQLENAQKGISFKKKKRSEKLSRNGIFKTQGAKLFFEKTVYNRNRFAKFGLFTPTALTYLSICVLSNLFFKFVIKTNSVVPVCFVMLVAVFFNSIFNVYAEETNYLFIFSVPEKPINKIFYYLAGKAYVTFFDLVFSFVAICIFLNKSVIEALLFFLLWVSLDVFSAAVGLFSNLFLPSFIVNSIKVLLNMFIKMMTVLPGMIILCIGIATNLSPALIGVLAINLSVSALLSYVSGKILHLGKN